MKRWSLLFTVFVLASVPVRAEESAMPGPQEGAPNIYKQLFDNEKVRISEIKFNPGDKAPMHKHSYPHAVYILEGGTLAITKDDGTSQTLTAKPGEVLWLEPETHEAVNTGETVLRATVTEIK